MFTRQLCLCVCIALVATACGSSSNSGGTTGGTGGATNTVTISSFGFSPDPITVAAGSTITVVNKDTAAHTATAEAAAKAYTAGTAPGGFAFDTGQIAGGSSATINVPATIASGTAMPYFCNNHKSGMTNPDPVIKVQ